MSSALLNVPIVVAHRGLHARAPENSLAAFADAGIAGIPWVECDIWPSADGVAVVIHDQMLERTTIGTGPVTDHTWGQLQALGLPSLLNVLAVLSEGIGLLVEIKPPHAGSFVDEVAHLLTQRQGPWMVQSFHEENLTTALLTSTSVHAAFLVEDAATLKRALEQAWPSIHAEYSLIDLGLVEQLHACGRKIGAWTVNDPVDIQRMIAYGIDMLITDQPALACGLITTR